MESPTKEKHDQNGTPAPSSKAAKLRRLRTYVTVEPLLACYVLPSVLASIAVQNLNLEKACRVNLRYPDEVCTALITQSAGAGNRTSEEIEVQALVAYMTSWRLPMQTAIPAVAVLFLGAWSDRTGRRKPFMLVPILGEFLSSAGLVLCTYYFLQWPLEVAGVLEGLPPALTGGFATMFMAIFSYLADNTEPEERTFRIGIVNVIISVAIPVGTALSGIMLNRLGFYGVFSICMGIYVIGFLYGSAVIRDRKLERNAETGEQIDNKCATFFDWRLVYDTVMVLFKPRRFNKRARTILVMVCYIIVSGPVHGSGPLIYLYARRNYGFNEIDFSLFSSYALVVNLVGVLLAITLLSKILKIDDSAIAALACTAKVAASFVYALAPTKTWFYAGPAVEFIGGAAVVAMRSIATKVVEVDEVGKINSVFGVCDAIINVIYTPIFAAFYVNTVASFPGAFCLLAALFLVPSIGVFIYMYKLQKEDSESEAEEKKKLSYVNEASEITAF